MTRNEILYVFSLNLQITVHIVIPIEIKQSKKTSYIRLLKNMYQPRLCLCLQPKSNACEHIEGAYLIQFC